MHRATVTTLVVLLLSGPAYAGDDIVTRKSTQSVSATMDCLEKAVKAKGMGVVARVDHAAAARGAGLELRPTQLLIFGNPKVGTPLMQSNQVSGIDLPLKALAWEDDKGQVWLSYNTPAGIAARHGIGDQGAVVEKMTGALGAFADAATGPGSC